MKKNIIIISTIATMLIMFALTLGYKLGNADYLQSAKQKTETEIKMPAKVDLSDKEQFDYVCDFMGQIVDWNCSGGEEDELAITTKDGYEVYAQKSESVYPANIKQFVGFNDVQSWEINGNQLVITTITGDKYTFNK